MNYEHTVTCFATSALIIAMHSVPVCNFMFIYVYIYDGSCCFQLFILQGLKGPRGPPGDRGFEGAMVRKAWHVVQW